MLAWSWPGAGRRDLAALSLYRELVRGSIEMEMALCSTIPGQSAPLIGRIARLVTDGDAVPGMHRATCRNGDRRRLYVCDELGY